MSYSAAGLAPGQEDRYLDRNGSSTFDRPPPAIPGMTAATGCADPQQKSTDGQCYRAKDSFSLDACGLDDGPPLLDLGLLESAQRLGGLLLALRNTLSEIGEPLAHHSPS